MMIAQVSSLYPPVVVGGAEKYVRDLSEGLAGRDYDVHVLTTGPQAPVRRFETSRAGDVDIHRYNPLNVYHPIEGSEESGWKKPPHHLIDLWNPHSFVMMRRKLEALNPDVLHTHNFEGISSAGFAAAASLGIPIIHSLHDYRLIHLRPSMFKDGSVVEPGVPSNILKVFNRIAVERCVERVVGPSRFIVEKHEEHGLFRNTPTTVLPYGLDRPGPEQKDAAPDNYEGTDESSELRLLYAGQLAPHKNVGILVDAVSRMTDMDVRLDILGDGEKKSELEAATADEPNVHLHGFISDDSTLSQFYARADATVVPSIWYDNSPTVIYESYLQGTPVVGADIGGIPELIKKGETGVVFDPTDVDALIESLHELHDIPQERLERNVSQFIDKLSMTNHLDEITDIYGEIT